MQPDLLDWLRREAERASTLDPVGAMILLRWADELSELRDEKARLRQALKGASVRLARIKRTAKLSSTSPSDRNRRAAHLARGAH